MANVIKGLTVEIGGDTTKLGKALEDVNKKSRDLSSELGDINRLLKLDPGNTELLTQKQKVLADAITNTGKKLDTLKEAEKQVQEQFERGEVSEEQVRALEREIVATTKKMESYEKAAKETADALKGVGDESKETEEASGKMGEALGNAAKVGLAAVAAAATAAIAGLVAAAESTREYRAEMGKLDAAFTSSGFNAETAATAYNSLIGVIGETDQSVEAAQQIALLADSEKDVAAWSELAAGVVGKFGDALQPETFFEAANETMKLGEATGAFTQMLEGTGHSVEEFNAGLAACSTEAEKQAYMLSVAEDALGSAGEAYRENNAEVIRANEANEAWTASLAEVGAVVDPIITDVKLLGASLLSDLVPGVTQLATAFRGLLSGDAGAAEGIGEALSGIVTGLLQKVTELAPSLVQVATSLITTLTSSLIGMLPQIVLVGIQLVSSIISGIGQAFPQIVNAIVAMLPILIAQLPVMIQTLLTALLGCLPQIIQGCVMLLQGLVLAVPLLVETLLPMIPQIITELANALAEAFPIIMTAALELAVLLVTQVAPRIIVEIVKALPAILEALVQGLVKIYNSIKAKLEEWDAKLAEWFNGIWQSIKDWAANLWSRITTWLANVVQKVVDFGKRFISSIVSFLSELPGKVATWLTNALNKVTTWATNLVTKGKNAAKELVSAVVNGIKDLPSKLLSIGQDLVSGLWNGITNKLSWLKDKISGFTSSVLDSIKGFFGVNSPSKETAWIGDMLDQGLAKGVLDNASDPIKAVQRVSGRVLDAAAIGMNGLALDRQLSQTASVNAAAAASDGGLLAKLDKILDAIERGQILTIDGEQLVGATADKIDNALGKRRALAARGAV